eukprot:6549021-Ditylum_brightwellii.AAC.1
MQKSHCNNCKCISCFSPPTLNAQGQITSWNSASKDGQDLKAMFEREMVDTMTATQLKGVYPQFKKYARRTLNSALQNLKN